MKACIQCKQKLFTFSPECSDFKVWPVSQPAENTSNPFACSPKALKEMTLIIFLCISDWIMTARKVLLCTVGNGVIICFCKASTATEASCGRGKNRLPVPHVESLPSTIVIGLTAWVTGQNLSAKCYLI